jgi:hypothetical protein
LDIGLLRVQSGTALTSCLEAGCQEGDGEDGGGEADAQDESGDALPIGQVSADVVVPGRVQPAQRLI